MIKKIGVLGAGTMGHGIAEAFAIHEYEVNLYEIDDKIRNNVKEQIREELKLLAEEKIIKNGDIEHILRRIDLYSEVKPAVKDRDYVIEVVPENLHLKQKIFKELDNYCPEHAILATNTSSLSLKKITDGISKERKQKIMVNHWYNPAHIMPIAELSYFAEVSDETYDRVQKLYESIGKQTVKVKKDIPGLVANRIQQGVAREVFSLIEKGVAEPEDIDKALKFGPAFRYATTGQLEIADFGGLDIWSIVGDNLLKEMDNSQSANPLLRKKVEEGKLGLKSGEGFYKYPESEKKEIKDKYIKKLIHQLKTSDYYQ
ncbi:MAG: 3-hydroxyacyl-CoA dehydrogenase family protein [Firmicutes bacterium]|nr:3-hydroxyacyl-CoA dehydrogenase family protein [Bacillota bacterium]